MPKMPKQFLFLALCTLIWQIGCENEEVKITPVDSAVIATIVEGKLACEKAVKEYPGQDKLAALMVALRRPNTMAK